MKRLKKIKKAKFKVKKDGEKDYSRKSNLFGDLDSKVIYPAYESELKFDGIEFNFKTYKSFGHMPIEIEFKKDLVKLPKNRIEYSQDFTTKDGRLLLLNFKKDSKGETIVTGVDIL